MDEETDHKLLKNGFVKYIRPNKAGRTNPLLKLNIGDEYFFDTQLKRTGKNKLYMRLKRMARQHPEIVFATKNISNGTIVKRVE